MPSALVKPRATTAPGVPPAFGCAVALAASAPFKDSRSPVTAFGRDGSTPVTSITSTIQPCLGWSRASSWRCTVPMSYQTVPDRLAACCTSSGSRQALCTMSALHSGSEPGLLLKALRSAVDGRRAGISPPPSTITALLTGEALSAAAPTTATAVMALALVAPAAITVELVQLNAEAPAVPVQVQPVPVGVAVSVRPAGRRSSTVYAPLVGALPALRTRML